MLPYVVIALSSSSLPPIISFEQVHSSSSFESLTNDMKVVMDFFLCDEVTSSRLNMSLRVGGSIHVFNQWDLRVGEGDIVVKCVGLFSFKNHSLVTSSGETCHYCTTWLS
jgi:hypothetical protein